MGNVSENYALGYEQGREEGRDEIVDFIFGELADDREHYSFKGDTRMVWYIDKLSARIDAYIDDMRGVWNV